MVTNVLPRGFYAVSLDNGHTVICHLTGNMRRNHIHVVENDRVRVELSPYDLTRGRIIHRAK